MPSDSLPELRLSTYDRTVRAIRSAALVGIATMAHAAVLRVPDPWPDLQETPDSAQLGDTVLVGPGTYVGDFIWPDRPGVCLLSEAGAAATILDGNRTETVLGLYHASIDTTTVIRGFTVTNGRVEGY